MNKLLSLSLASVLLASLPACQRQDEETQRKLDYLISKVDTLEKKVATGAIGNRQAAAGGAQRPGRPDPTQTYYVPVDTAKDAIKGPKQSKVTIVEAFEFACPYCAMLHEPMTKVLEQNPDVRIVSKQFVVHPDTATAPALAACAATKQGKYAQFEKALWAASWPMEGGRPSMKREMLAPEKLDEIAKSVGLDVSRFKADRDGADCKAHLEQTRKDLSAVGVSGTPSIYINGKPYQGGRTPEAIGAAIAEAKKEADQLIAKGGATADTYYDSLMKSAKKTL